MNFCFGYQVQVIDGDGKVNLSVNGREVTIIPVRDPKFSECNRLAGVMPPRRFSRVPKSNY